MKKQTLSNKILSLFFVVFCLSAGTIALTACTGETTQETKTPEARAQESEKSDADSPEILHFVDVYQNPYQVEINPRVKKHDYKMDAFVRNGQLLSYEGDSNYTCRLGVDVSEHQGYVDWQALKASGFDFAFIRLGYRGYGQEGNIRLDKEFHQNTFLAFADNTINQIAKIIRKRIAGNQNATLCTREHRGYRYLCWLRLQCKGWRGSDNKLGTVIAAFSCCRNHSKDFPSLFFRKRRIFFLNGSNGRTAARESICKNLI